MHCSVGFAITMKTRYLIVDKQSHIEIEIAAELGHPKTIVYIVLKRLERHGTIEGQKSTRCPWKLSKHSIRVVTRTLALDYKQTLVDITNCNGFDVSISIVRKALHEVGFYNRVIQKKPFLSNAHRHRRLEFATQHRKWTCEEWKKIILDK
jgi:transposase